MKKLLCAFFLLCAPLASAQVLCPSGYSFNGICWSNPQGTAIMGGQSGTGTGGQGGSITIAPGAPTGASTAVGTFTLQLDPTNPAINFKCVNPTQGGVGTAACSFNGVSVTGASLAVPVSATNGGTGEAGILTGIPKANGAGAFTLATQDDGTNLFVLTADANSLAVGTGALTQGGITGTRNTAFGQGGLLDSITSGFDNVAVGTSVLGGDTTGSNNVGVGVNVLAVSNGDGNVGIGRDVLQANTTGSNNVGVGYTALNANTTGLNNIGVGEASLLLNTTGFNNTAVGAAALGSNTTASNNNAFGDASLQFNTTGDNNAAYGKESAFNNTTGASNTAIGNYTLRANTTGGQNVAVGTSALSTSTTASGNVAVGYQALKVSTTAANNVGVGQFALATDTTGGSNIAVGTQSLLLNTTGQNNVGIGVNALEHITTSSQSIGIGTSSLQTATTGASNVAIGYQTGLNITTGSSNTILGTNVGSTLLTTGSNNILIGTSSATAVPAAATSNEINIGGLLFWNDVSLAAPVVSACGTSPTIDAHANNRSGTVTVGTVAAASCTITFAGGGYTTWNHCRVTSQAVIANFAYSYTLTAITATGTSLLGDLIDYDCDGL